VLDRFNITDICCALRPTAHK